MKKEMKIFFDYFINYKKLSEFCEQEEQSEQAYLVKRAYLKNNFATNSGYDKAFIFLSFMLVLSVLLIPHASSLGITPGRTTIDYESGIEKEISFSVLNTENKDMQVAFMVQGELNNSITMYDRIAEFRENDESKQFRYKINLPNGIGTSPGLHTADIIALEVPKSNAAGTFVGATVAVVSQLYVYVPYPGKYLDADLNIMDGEENNTATFIVPAINRGKVGIGEARAIIDIYDVMNNKISTVETDYRPVNPGARTELSGKWNVSVPSGNYIAKVTLLYDGETRNVEKQFAIGIRSLLIGSIIVNDFRLGEVAKLQILVENRWSSELKSVFANMLVYDNEQQVMADVRSPSENIPALTQKELIAYWDTVGVKEGEYSGKLMVKYGDKSSDRNLILTVKENSLDIIGVGFAINPNPTKGISMTQILIVLVILLIIINITWFVFFRLSMKKRKTGKI